MKITTLDFETSFQVINNQKDPSPYLSDNFLVSYGLWHQDELIYKCFKHKEKQPDEDAFSILKTTLENTDLLIAFNAKFELSWLKAIGLEYKGKIFDPMIAAYVLAKGQKLGMGLGECCKRFQVEEKKSELVEKYLRDNIGFDVIPWEVVEEYGRGDVVSTLQLYHKLVDELDKQPHLWPTVNLMCQFCRCLTDIEFNGLKIDVASLSSLEEEYKAELKELEDKLHMMVKEVMGDTPINLDSPEQLSWVLFSRKVIDKKRWKEVFNLGTELRGSVLKPKYKPKMSVKEFVGYVQNLTEIVYVSRASRCSLCEGAGKLSLNKIDGSPYKKARICRSCEGSGLLYLADESKIAGFKLLPRGPIDTAAGGFSTSSSTLEILGQNAKDRSREFLEALQRSSSIRTYLASFVEGTRRGIRNNDILHPTLMQVVAATGRLVSRNPNFHNQPRGNTFPVRRTVISRFPNGKILEGDFKQLEFRAAADLSGNKKMLEDILNNVDVHSVTSKWTGKNRQDAKSDTFAPLFGATPHGKPDNIAKYYSHFIEKYDLDKWHQEWFTEVLETGGYILPSGREFIFPHTKRQFNGGVTNSTIIKNYKIQSWATADLVPIALIKTWKLFLEYKLKSLIILTVHDSILIDCHPDEVDICIHLLKVGMNCLEEECLTRYNYKLTVPIEAEYKIGDNWLKLESL